MHMCHWGTRAMGWDPEMHNSNRVMGWPRGANLGPSRRVHLKITIVKSKSQNKISKLISIPYNCGMINTRADEMPVEVNRWFLNRYHASRLTVFTPKKCQRGGPLIRQDVAYVSRPPSS